MPGPNERGDTVVRLDPSTNRVTATIRVGVNPLSVAFDSGSVWVANYGDGTISRIDPDTSQVQSIEVGAHPTHIALDAEGSLWIVTEPASPAFGG